MPLATQNTLSGEDKGNPLSPFDKEKASGSSAITTWTRLAVGAMMYGVDILRERTHLWEGSNERQTGREERASGMIIEGESLDGERFAHSHDPQSNEQGLHTLVGVLFDTQKHLDKNISAFRRVERLADRLTYSIMKGLRRQPVFKPAYRMFDCMVSRGESELQRWEEIGKVEEARSRKLLKSATLSTFDSSIDYLSTNPDIQELVQYQSTNLLNDLIEEVRERAVSVNTVLEGWVRKTLRLVPRSEIPGPPPEVRRRADLFISINKRSG